MSEQQPVGAVPANQEADQNERNSLSLRSKIVAGVAGVALVAGAGFGVVSCIDRDGGDGPADDKTPAELTCEDFTEADAASNSGKYNDFAFLPFTEKLSNGDDVKEYVSNLFNENGPLANEGDRASMAAAMAAFGAPSHDGEAVNPNYSVLNTYADRYAAYSAEGGDKAAAEDCQKVLETLNQDAEYTDLWNAKGAIVTQLVAERDEDFNITGVSLERVVLPNDLGGLELKRRETSKYGGEGETGYNEVLISKEGQIYFTGLTEGEGGSLDLSDLEPEETDPTNSPVPQGDTPFAGGEILDTTVDQETGNVTTTGTNANGDLVVEVRTPSGETTITTTPANGGTSIVTTGETPAGTGTTPTGTTGTTPTGTTGTTPTGTGTTPTPTPTQPPTPTPTQPPTPTPTQPPTPTTTQRPTTTTTQRPTTTTTEKGPEVTIPGAPN